MAAIQTSLQVADRMTPALRAISSSMGIVINTFEEMQAASGRAIDIAALQAARSELANVESAIEQVNGDIRTAAGQQGNLNNHMREGQSIASGLTSKVKQLVEDYAGIRGIKMAVHFVADTVSLQNVQNEAETKLQEIMQQRMGASPEAIQSVKDLASAQQQLGVVGDEVQLMGAQQLSTFLNSDSALKSLIPTMNNLAVQQNGVNVSSEAMINIGNMMGKVMQGQVGALTRVGVTFTEAQEKVLKYGNEQERAATLAEVITDTVGNMNAIMAATPQGQIQQMANAWGDIKETVGSSLYPAVMQFFETLNTNMPQAQNLIMGLAGVLSAVIEKLSEAINAAGQVAGFFQNNWSVIEPIIWGIVGAFAAYNIIMGISNTLALIHTALETGEAGGSLLAAAAIFIQTLAQEGLNAALRSCPIMWIAMLIGVVIAAIAAWVKHVGGLRIAWLTVVNAVLTAADNLKIGFQGNVDLVMTALDFLKLGFLSAKTGILDTLGKLKVNGLMIIQDFINGVIDGINTLIEKVNSIGLISIDTIQHVEFGTNAALEEETKRQERASELAAEKEKVKSNQQERIENEERMKREADEASAARKAQIDELKRQQAKGNNEKVSDGGGNNPQIEANTGNTASNTAKMADSMDILDEELKYMRDAAEQEVINRFTLADMKIDISNNNTLTTKTDFDDVNRMFGDVTAEALATMAEGAYA